jgi:hypothetical protein
MVAAFAHSLRDSLAGLSLNADAVHDLESHQARLGSLDVPTSVDPQTAATIRAAIAEAFVFGFRLIMLLCNNNSSSQKKQKRHHHHHQQWLYNNSSSTKPPRPSSLRL